MSQTELPSTTPAQTDEDRPAEPAAAPVETGHTSSASTKPWTVVIDPGHGGEDGGETGPGGAEEKAITLSIARRLAEKLADTCTVSLTRQDDSTVSTSERVSKANYDRGSLFISVHTGASASSTANGFELFVPEVSIAAPGRLVLRASPATEDSTRDLAVRIASALNKATGAPSRGIHSVPCRVFQGLNMPGVLVEVGFISNAIEEPLLVDEAYQRKIAEGIAAGIQSFMSSSG